MYLTLLPIAPQHSYNHFLPCAKIVQIAVLVSPYKAQVVTMGSAPLLTVFSHFSRLPWALIVAHAISDTRNANTMLQIQSQNF
jgi:hypothetical protein